MVNYYGCKIKSLEDYKDTFRPHVQKEYTDNFMKTYMVDELMEDLMETRWKMLQQSKYFNRGVYWAVFIGWVIGILGPEHKFVKVPGVEKMKIEHIIQLQEGDTEAK